MTSPTLVPGLIVRSRISPDPVTTSTTFLLIYLSCLVSGPRAVRLFRSSGELWNTHLRDEDKFAFRPVAHRRQAEKWGDHLPEPHVRPTLIQIRKRAKVAL